MSDIVRYALPISLGQLPEFEKGAHYVAVTFDDGLCSAIENAIPELESRGIPSTHFIVAGSLGRQPDWPTSPTHRTAANERVASAEQLVTLSPLVTFGSHSVTHPLLTATSEAVARRELSDSRCMLETVLGKRIELFSFPYGAFNAELVELCFKVGYLRVFTSRPYLAFTETQERVVGRVPVSPADWNLEFRLKILGAYRWLPYGIALKRQLAHLRAVVGRSG
jgi:peptidoglycan/xylan/chitin deacetylase (PgdA/CDA1 family)